MWLSRGHGSRKRGEGNGLVAVAVDKDKGSQNALKWAMENLLSKGQTVVLIHVFSKSSSSSFVAGHGAAGDYFSPGKQHLEKMAKDLFLAFRCYCTRKDVHCLDVALESTDIAKAITEYVAHAAIETLVLGTPSRSGFMRKFKADVPSAVSRGAPDFCTVYAVSKGKRGRHQPTITSQLMKTSGTDLNTIVGNNRSPFGAGRYAHSVRSIGDLMSETDISFVSSNRPSTDRMSSATYDFMDSGLTQRLSTSSATSFASMHSGPKFTGPNSQQGFSSFLT
ncbi:hypothetical protein OIU74_004567 [Salix koriyanagi]|uniref:RING-type E3 ubiquitin transferase n=1 Tax=Salix koriyanagi TaxID=2511006 RepID=A0A9Q0ZFM2_9ROSI|nr:hypothetical protein OIU74_004567 [Salix koriyanagi]